MQRKSELCLLTLTILTRGSEFLMAWTNWSQTWATTGRTTTSRRPLQRRRKCLRLQNDPRLKLNQEDLQPLAHIQGLFLCVKDLWINMDWPWTRSSIWSSAPKAKRINTLFRHGELPEEDGDRIPETGRWSSEQICSTLNIWWCMEEQNGRRRRQQHKISILFWPVRTRNSLPSKSFRTQSHWSFTAGQCIDSDLFLQVHLSYRMCSQLTLHHKFRNDTKKTKFEQKTDGILHSRESHE